MKLDALLDLLMSRLFRDHYGAERVREFKRDERALMGAIARYGHECAQRGWEFEEAKIFADLNRLLDSIRAHRASIKFLPLYLENAVDKHVRQRAEELNEEAKEIRNQVKRLGVGSWKPAEVVIERPVVEVLSDLYRDIKRRKRNRRVQKAAGAALKQETLL